MKIDTERLSRRLFLTVSIGAIAAFLFLFGMYSGYRQTTIFRLASVVYDGVRESLSALSETSLVRPDHLLQPSRYQGSGVTLNIATDEGDLVFLSGFFGEDHEARLLARDGRVIKRWPLRFSEIFTDTTGLSSPPRTNWNVDTHGALAMPDGSIVFNFDYNGTARLDRCGRVLWSLARESHHSVERAEGGGFWVPGGKVVADESRMRFPPFSPPYIESTLMRVSDDGTVMHEISVIELFYENGLESLLTSAAVIYEPRALNTWNREIVHMNKISELSTSMAPDFPMFAPGDLLLSFRNKNMLMVVDPGARKVKWWRIGPWLRQHDPEFRAGGTIAVFNNNTLIDVLGASDRSTRRTNVDIPRVSNILDVNPKTGVSRVLYGGRWGQQMLSVTRGKVEMTPRGGLLVTEFDGGRVFETDAYGQIVWQYINRYDEDEVAEITEARLYPANYFHVSDWSCAQ